MKSTGRFTADLRRLMQHSYDHCQSCGGAIAKGTAAFAGYDSKSRPLYVGPCCQSLIEELATHVYWWWEVDKRCAADLSLWRYMDFAKFVSLLENKAIYFARADTLGDPFEGAAGTAERQPEWDSFYVKFFRDAIATVPGRKEAPSEEELNQQSARLLTDLKKIGETDRLRTFVSCWHANSGESEALWRLYCPLPSPGVAIQTTVGRLEESLGDDPNIRIGKVQYIDFKQGFAGFHDRIFWKRKSLSHETEVRAIIQSHKEQSDKGRLVSAKLEILIRQVVPSPFAPAWFHDLINKILERYGTNALVRKSELLSQPFY